MRKCRDLYCPRELFYSLPAAMAGAGNLSLGRRKERGGTSPRVRIQFVRGLSRPPTRPPFGEHEHGYRVPGHL